MAVGVVIVTYNASEIILDCLESMLASTDVDLRVVVVDNASKDDTVATIRNWAAEPTGWTPTPGDYFTPVQHGPVTLTTSVPAAGKNEIALIASDQNTGFAGGVNVGMRLLQDDADVDYFWVLNPDCVAENRTGAALVDFANKSGPFSIMGGRVYLKNPPFTIQVDGGKVNFLTGICNPYNLMSQGPDIPTPASETLDYISGAHMFASREFVETVGLMDEDYFLYYEEIDWCCRRGDLPLLFCPDAPVHHEGGHSLGSAHVDRGPSAMAAYFMGRSRMRFMKVHRPTALPIVYLYSVAKSVKFFLKGQSIAGFAMLRGISGLRPPLEVRERLAS
jgi:GT2 family glycosyltransferase